jgi:hypothetical protein
MARSIGRHRHSFFATVALLTFAVAPLALAQSATKAKKKAPKPAASASASASATESPAEETTAAAAPTTEAPAAPAESAAPDTAAASASDTGVAADDITNTVETPGKTYRYVGLRYRMTIIPSFLEHLFVEDGGTVFSNTFGAELDFRKDAKSTILWLQYTEYGFGDTLFLQKSQPDVQNNYSIVSSSLKGIYVGLDELWSTPIANHVDFEYGFGLGLGAIFGSLTNDWAYIPAAGTTVPGAIQGSNGNFYAKCTAPTSGPDFIVNGADIGYGSCDARAHSNSTEQKNTGNYTEKNWFQGGAVPVIFPYVAGNLGIRYKPIKQLQTRLGLGIALTGFWFGISADYGIDSKPEDTHPAGQPPSKPAEPPSSDKSSREVGPRDTL